MGTVVVGLGNPGPEYQKTRHNVGHQVLERLAARLGARVWRRDGQAMTAHGEWRGEPVHLAKPLTYMNVSGPAVAGALRRLHAGADDLVLVYDDIDLPLGTVRVRMRGSHGGHNGVRSVIQALGTSEIRRVKVGIGRPEHRSDVSDHVLTRFEYEELPLVETSLEEAVEKVLSLLDGPCPARSSPTETG